MTDASITSGFVTNTKCLLSRGRNPEHHLEDLSALIETVVVSTEGA